MKAKRCSECGKVLRDFNKSGLCNYHVKGKCRRLLREKRRGIVKDKGD